MCLANDFDRYIPARRAETASNLIRISLDEQSTDFAPGPADALFEPLASGLERVETVVIHLALPELRTSGDSRETKIRIDIYDTEARWPRTGNLTWWCWEVDRQATLLPSKRLTSGSGPLLSKYANVRSVETIEAATEAGKCGCRGPKIFPTCTTGGLIRRA